MDQLHAAAVALRLGWRRHGQRPFEVVDHSQHLVDEVGRGPLGELTPFALDALAEVVEFGGLAQQPVAQVVALAGQPVELSRQVVGSGRCGVAGEVVGSRNVTHGSSILLDRPHRRGSVLVAEEPGHGHGGAVHDIDGARVPASGSGR